MRRKLLNKLNVDLALQFAGGFAFRVTKDWDHDVVSQQRASVSDIAVP